MRSRSAPQHSRRTWVPADSWVFLLLALPLPGAAVFLLADSFDWPVVGGIVAAVNVIAYGMYAWDKRKARLGMWRTPESTLHLIGLMGGWPGAWAAQHFHRHKTAKPGFQRVFIATVLMHQLASYDYLQGGRWTSAALQFFQAQLAR